MADGARFGMAATEGAGRQGETVYLSASAGFQGAAGFEKGDRLQMGAFWAEHVLGSVLALSPGTPDRHTNVYFLMRDFPRLADRAYVCKKTRHNTHCAPVDISDERVRDPRHEVHVLFPFLLEDCQTINARVLTGRTGNDRESTRVKQTFGSVW